MITERLTARMQRQIRRRPRTTLNHRFGCKAVVRPNHVHAEIDFAHGHFEAAATLAGAEDILHQFMKLQGQGTWELHPTASRSATDQ